MPVQPIVRYMLLCKDWKAEPGRSERISVFGLVTNIAGNADRSYPVVYPELCVLLILTEVYRAGRARIVFLSEESGASFTTSERLIESPGDPLHVSGVSFRVRDCRFHHRGFYSAQFHFDGQVIEERPIFVR